MQENKDDFGAREHTYETPAPTTHRVEGLGRVEYTHETEEEPTPNKITVSLLLNGFRRRFLGAVTASTEDGTSFEFIPLPQGNLQLDLGLSEEHETSLGVVKEVHFSFSPDPDGFNYESRVRFIGPDGPLRSVKLGTDQENEADTREAVNWACELAKKSILHVIASVTETPPTLDRER